MAGIRLWELYIRVPQDLVDDPDVNPSLNAIRLLLYLCRHCARLNKTVLRLSQDDILYGRKAAGVRVDGGAKLAGPRHLIQAREELVALGWVKYYNLEGAFVYELVIEDQPVGQFPKGTAAGSQKELLPVPKRNRNQFPKGTETSSQKEQCIYIGITEQGQNKVRTGNAARSSASPDGYRSALEAIKISDARQEDLMQNQPALLAAESSEDFNSVEVARAMLLELALAGNENLMLLDDALKNYRAKNPARRWDECGEDLIALWNEYDRTVNVKKKYKVKGFFRDGVFTKRSEWAAQDTKQSGMQSATEVLRQRRERLAKNGE